jgi:hypothetical protein
MATIEGTKINGGRKRSLEILLRLDRACAWRMRGTCRFDAGMNETGVSDQSDRCGDLLEEAWQADSERPPAWPELIT